MAILIWSPRRFGLLSEMERALARMEAYYAEAQEHLAQVTVDEPGVAKVGRDTPM